MKYLLLSGIILSFVFSGIIFFKKKDKSPADNMLAIWLIFLGLDYLRSFFLFEEGKMFLLGFGYIIPAINAPFLYLYVYTFASAEKKFNKKLLFHLIPFLLFSSYLVYFLFLMSPADKHSFFTHTTFAARPFLFNFFEIVMAIITPVYIVLVIRLLKNHYTNIKNNFSFKEKIDLKWINYLLISACILWTVATLTKLLTGYFNTLQYSSEVLMVSYFELIIVVIIGYFGFHQEILLFKFPETNVQTENVKKYKSTGLTEEDSNQLKTRVLDYMRTKKPYLISDLSINKLADMLAVSSHHLSQVINGQLGKNFYEFVNEYRVEEVKQQINQNMGKKFTLLSIAYESGFNSKSTFNSIFKKYTQQTPKEYMHNFS